MLKNIKNWRFSLFATKTILPILLIQPAMMSAIDLEVHSGPRHYIVDFRGIRHPDKDYLLEVKYHGRNGWQSCGVYTKTADFNTFLNLYNTWAASVAELNWLQLSNEHMAKLWEAKKDVNHIDELEPIRDRTIYLALGFSVFVMKIPNVRPEAWRWRDPKTQEVFEIKHLEYNHREWPSVQVRDFKVFEDFPSISWQSKLDRKLLGFKLYRSVEFMDRWEPHVQAEISVSVNEDTLICIARDTQSNLAGIFQYYITLIDIAGNEGPPSEIIRMPHMGHYPNPIVTYFHVVGNKERRTNSLYWTVQNTERVRYIEIWRKPPLDTLWSYLISLDPEATSFEDDVDIVLESYDYKLVLGDLVFDQTIESVPNFGISEQKTLPFANLSINAENSEDGIRVSVEVENALFLRGIYITRCEQFETEMDVVSPMFAVDQPRVSISWTDTTTSYFQPNTPYGYSLLLVSDAYEYFPAGDTAYVWPKVNIDLPAPRIFIHRIDEDGKGLIAWHHEDFEELPIREFRVYPLDNKRNANRENYVQVPGEHNLLELQKANPGDQFLVSAVHWLGQEGPSSDTISLEGVAFDEVFTPIQLWITMDGSDPVIHWPDLDLRNLEAFEIYRSIGDDGPPELIGKVTADIHRFKDNLSQVEDYVLYFIRPMYKNGIMGPYSEKLFYKKPN